MMLVGICLNVVVCSLSFVFITRYNDPLGVEVAGCLFCAHETERLEKNKYVFVRWLHPECSLTK